MFPHSLNLFSLFFFPFHLADGDQIDIGERRLDTGPVARRPDVGVEVVDLAQHLVAARELAAPDVDVLVLARLGKEGKIRKKGKIRKERKRKEKGN